MHSGVVACVCVCVGRNKCSNFIVAIDFSNHSQSHSIASMNRTNSDGIVPCLSAVTASKHFDRIFIFAHLAISNWRWRTLTGVRTWVQCGCANIFNSIAKLAAPSQSILFRLVEFTVIFVLYNQRHWQTNPTKPNQTNELANHAIAHAHTHRRVIDIAAASIEVGLHCPEVILQFWLPFIPHCAKMHWHWLLLQRKLRCEFLVWSETAKGTESREMHHFISQRVALRCEWLCARVNCDGTFNQTERER